MAAVYRVALAGYMGVGKSTIAQTLAERWACTAHDLDAEIEAMYGPIADQFFRDGERVFRARETDVLQTMLARCPQGNLVLALGGGALLQPANRQVLRQAGVCTVYLRMPLWLGWSRVADSTGRPLVTGSYAAYRARFERRRRLYRMCDLRVDVYPGSPVQVAKRVDAALRHKSTF